MQKLEPISVNQTQAAKLVGVTSRTLRRWEKSKRLIGFRHGKRGAKLYPFAQLKRLAGVQG